jgi:hypothetical protein
MQPTISLMGQRASATIFCNNLILDNDRLIVLLSAYGPSRRSGLLLRSSMTRRRLCWKSPVKKATA